MELRLPFAQTPVHGLRRPTPSTENVDPGDAPACEVGADDQLLGPDADTGWLPVGRKPRHVPRRVGPIQLSEVGDDEGVSADLVGRRHERCGGGGRGGSWRRTRGRRSTDSGAYRGARRDSGGAGRGRGAPGESHAAGHTDYGEQRHRPGTPSPHALTVTRSNRCERYPQPLIASTASQGASTNAASCAYCRECWASRVPDQGIRRHLRRRSAGVRHRSRG